VYLDFYGLKEAAFDLAPNPRYLFYSPRYREAFNHLLYGIRERKGFVQLTGEVGCGKTTICRAILKELGDHYATALILNPVLDADQLLRAIALEYGLNAKGMDRFETLSAFNQFLIDLLFHGRDAVLIIDEAQDLTPELARTNPTPLQPRNRRPQTPPDRPHRPTRTPGPPQQS
jgi:general secretion pathway protein A